MKKYILTGFSLFLWYNAHNSTNEIKKYANEPVEIMLSCTQVLLALTSIYNIAGYYNIPRPSLRQFSLWKEQYYRRSYDLLDDQFNDLSNEQQLELAKSGLAKVDASSKVFLKFICPISRSLIADPVLLAVKNSNNEIGYELYDKFFLDAALHNQISNPNLQTGIIKSPSTNREVSLDINRKPIVKAYSDMEEFNAYVKDLKRQMDYLRNISKFNP